MNVDLLDGEMYATDPWSVYRRLRAEAPSTTTRRTACGGSPGTPTSTRSNATPGSSPTPAATGRSSRPTRP
ncbi:hypothetical protein ACFQHO_15245 [Actinomadura yumaensis]|uniref:hypothetical protein n=1 Tax=Actinomadura yumaensis TaxID=111807 RepID=UPI003621207D